MTDANRAQGSRSDGRTRVALPGLGGANERKYTPDRMQAKRDENLGSPGVLPWKNLCSHARQIRLKCDQEYLTNANDVLFPILGYD